MSDQSRGGAAEPEDLARLFVERANEGDLEGLVAHYEPDAVLAFSAGLLSVGTLAIRAAYRDSLASRPVLSPGEQRSALRSGDLAMTSTRLLSGDITVEVARRQADGRWLWVLDRPNILHA